MVWILILFLPSLTSHPFLAIEPIAMGLLLPTELSMSRLAIDLIGKSQLPSPG
jgi:hypothetical protein